MCQCLKESENKLFAHLKEQISKDAKVKSFDESESHYLNKGLVFTGDGGWKLYMEYQIAYIPVKKDGSDGVPKKKTVNIFPTFCPFCGVKMKED